MILVTGASGLLGSSIILRCRDRGLQVAGMFHSHLLNVPGVVALEADLTDETLTRSLVTTLRPSAIVHCAAATAVDWCEDHEFEARRLNAESSGRLAALAKELGADFVYVSTDSVFDGTRGDYSEADQACPLNLYAKSKLQGEHEVGKQMSEALVVRVNLYGWSVSNKPSLAEWILTQLNANKVVPGFVDVIFCPMLANDVAETILRMLDLGLRGLYHVTGSEPVSKYEFARALANEFGLDSNLVVPAGVDRARLRAPRPRNVSLKTDKIRQALGYRMPNVVEGISRFKRLEENGYVRNLREFISEAAA